MRRAAGVFGGYPWIYDAHHYANLGENASDRGTYDLAPEGAWTHVTATFTRVDAALRYTPSDVYGNPTIVLDWKRISAGLAGTQ